MVIVGGLLVADADLIPSAKTHQLRDALIKVLPSGLWVPGQQSDDLASSPRWRPPDLDLVSDLAPALRAAWREAVQPNHTDGAVALRVTVNSIKDAHRLSQQTISGIPLVPSVETLSKEFAWRWPLRVGLAQGAKAEEWLQELRSDQYYGSLFEAHILPTRDRQTKFDIVLRDQAANWPPVRFLSPATCRA